MSISETIERDLKAAMIAKDVQTLTVLRMLKSSIHNKSIELKVDVVPEDEVMKLMKTESKKRKDSIEAFTKGGRDELVAQEKSELELLEKYLPEQMSEADVTKIVADIVAQAEDKNFGTIMKQVMAQTKGQADGKVVSAIVKQHLA